MQVSALTICLITLDRFLALRFPFSRLQFRGRSSLVASACLWVVGGLVAALPLLPAFAHWRFYGQTGICIPLPITRDSFLGRDYAFAIIIVLNFLLFVLVALGQAAVFLAVRANTMTSSSNVTVTSARSTSKDLVIARRLASVIVSNFLCWFPMGQFWLYIFLLSFFLFFFYMNT